MAASSLKEFRIVMTSNSIRKCTIGIKFNQVCHKQSYCKEVKTIFIENLSPVDNELVRWRTGINDVSATVCFHHREVYLQRCSATQSKCCDPTKHHVNSGKKRRKGKIVLEVLV